MRTSRTRPVVLFATLLVLAWPAGAGAQEQAPKPEPTGLEKLSPDWPSWLKVNVLYRGRVEALRPVVGADAPYDGYYLNRLRLSVGVRPTSWLQVVGQIQDAEAMGHQASPPPRTMAGGFDLRQGYVEVGRKGPWGVLIAGGRQEFSLGDGRLIASPDWGNSSRTFDMGKVSAWIPGLRLDVFRAAAVDVDPARFDRVKPGEYVWGGYASMDRLPWLSAMDVYGFQKATSVATGELGSRGDGRVSTFGTRLSARIGAGISADFEGALQRGRLAADSVAAWAVHAGIAWTAARQPLKPRLAVEYSHASGDRGARDGRRTTFDQVYASNHAKYGLADLVGWRNMQAVTAKLDIAPSKQLKVTGAVNRLWLATVADAWYGSSGSKVVTNVKATSRDIGWEPDVLGTYAVSKEMTLGAGVAVLLPGGYARQSAAVDRYWSPYLMWSLKF